MRIGHCHGVGGKTTDHRALLNEAQPFHTSPSDSVTHTASLKSLNNGVWMIAKRDASVFLQETFRWQKATIAALC
jgi:hypothetical protein